MSDLKMDESIKKYLLKLINNVEYGIWDFIEDLSKMVNLEFDVETNVLIEFINVNQDIFFEFDLNSKNIGEDFIDYVIKYPSRFGINHNEILHHNLFMKKMTYPAFHQRKIKNHSYFYENQFNKNFNIMSRHAGFYQVNKSNQNSMTEMMNYIDNGKVEKEILKNTNSMISFKRNNNYAKEILNSYYCNGIFLFNDGAKFISNFTLIQFIDGDIKLNVEYGSSQQYITLSKIFHCELYECSIEGELIDQSGRIIIKKAYLTSIKDNADFVVNSDITIIFKEDMSYDNIKFLLLNFLNNDNSFGDFIDFECDFEDYSIKFEGISEYKKYEKLLKENILNSAVTSFATIYTDVDVKEYFEKFTFFLSYINRNPIYFVCEEYYQDDILVKSVLSCPICRNFSNKDKLILSENLKDVLENYFENFLKYYSDFSLNIVISIFIEGLNIIYSEIGYLLIEMSLETFLSQYECYCQANGVEISNSAFNNKKSTLDSFFKNHDFEVINEDLDILAQDLSPNFTSVWDKFSHLRKNEKFKKNLKHKVGDDYFPTIRNKIVHTGKFPDTIKNGKIEIFIAEEFERLVYLFDRIMLTLISYEGYFFKLHGDKMVFHK